MEITFRNYTLTPEQGRFNLVKKETKQKQMFGSKEKLEETHEVDDTMGYGFTLENAIKEIINDILTDKDGVYTLQQYLAEYKAILAEITGMLDVPQNKFDKTLIDEDDVESIEDEV